MSALPGGDLRIAAVHVARTRALGGAVFLVGDDVDIHPLPATMGEVATVAAEGAADALRARARTGDAVVVLGAFPERDRLLARLPAWGVASVWVGEDRRPGDGLATVCVPGAAGEVLPQLLELADRLRHDPLALAPAVAECTDEVCVTCSDEGRLGEVLAVPATLFAPARVRTADGEEDVDITILGALHPGDLILIHAGMGIAVVPLPALVSSVAAETVAAS